MEKNEILKNADITLVHDACELVAAYDKHGNKLSVQSVFFEKYRDDDAEKSGTLNGRPGWFTVTNETHSTNVDFTINDDSSEEREDD